jgi:heme exporter protein C
VLTRVWGWLALAGLAAGLVMAFLVAPRELTQGNVQRIMYVHVPAAWVAYLAFVVVLVASIAYLATRRPGADWLAHASAEAGVVFTGLAIVAGSIWGKPTWGTWWTWDARLTTTAILFVIYLGYLLLRAMMDDPERGARYAAVVGIIGALDIPLVHFSVLWWREASAMDPIILVTLLVNVAAFTLLYAYFVGKGVRILRRRAEALA